MEEDPPFNIILGTKKDKYVRCLVQHLIHMQMTYKWNHNITTIANYSINVKQLAEY